MKNYPYTNKVICINDKKVSTLQLPFKNLISFLILFFMMYGDVWASAGAMHVDNGAVTELIDMLLKNNGVVDQQNELEKEVVILDEARLQLHLKIANVLAQFVDMKDKKHFLKYFQEITPLVDQINPVFTRDEQWLIELVKYLNSSATKQHIKFDSYWDQATNTTYWVNELATKRVLKRAMRLIIRILNEDAATKILAPNKKEWTPADVNLQEIILKKMSYQ